MSLLSKEEEISKGVAEIKRSIETILSYKNTLEQINPRITETLSKLILLIRRNRFSKEEARRLQIEVFRLVSKYCRNESFYEEIGISEEGLILDAMEDICLLDERNVLYRKNLNSIAGSVDMSELTIDGRNYCFVRDGVVHYFRRLLALREIQGIKLLLLYSQIVQKKKMDKCHQFNSGFSRIYPSGDLVTGNIVSPLKNVIIAHSWIEIEGRAISPNLNFSQSIEDYYRIALATDMVRIPFEKLEEDYQIIMQKNPTMEFYDYLRNPDETMARLK